MEGASARQHENLEKVQTLRTSEGKEHKLSLWFRRRVSIFRIYIQTSCCLVGRAGGFRDANAPTPL